MKMSARQFRDCGVEPGTEIPDCAMCEVTITSKGFAEDGTMQMIIAPVGAFEWISAKVSFVPSKD